MSTVIGGIKVFKLHFQEGKVAVQNAMYNFKKIKVNLPEYFNINALLVLY